MIRKRYGNDTERIGEKCSMETGWRGGPFSLQSCLNGLFFIWFADALYENRVWLSNCKIRGLRAGKEILTEETRESYGISTGTIRDFSGKSSFDLFVFFSPYICMVFIHYKAYGITKKSYITKSNTSNTHMPF